MEPHSEKKDGHLKPGYVFCAITVALTCFLLILFFIIICAFLTAGVAGHIYDAQHAIPNPVDRGDDLGAGLVVIYWALASMVVSVPMSFLLFKFLFKLFSKLLRCK